MGKKSAPAPAPPPAPDPAAQVSAQAKALPSAYTPYGSRVYSGDPNVAGSFKYTETLAPSQQRQFDAGNRIAEALLGRAETQIPQIPADPFEFRGDDPNTNMLWQSQKGLLDDVFAREQRRLDQRLTNQGIPMGSEAYRQEMDDQTKRQSRAYGDAAAASLGQGFQQAAAQRQQNYNELAALLGGQQLGPIGGPAGGSPIDVASAYAAQQAGQNTAYQGQLANYNAGVGSRNSMMSGLFGLGAAGIGLLSDPRLKVGAVRIDTLPSGLGVYRFRYVWGGPERVGVMADEVLAVQPDAVSFTPAGYARVDYSQVEGYAWH